MKKVFCCLILVMLFAANMAFAGGGGEAASAGSKPSFEMSISYGGADGAEEDITAKEFKKRVEEKSKGQLTAKCYGYEQLGKEVDMVNQLQLGTIDMAIMGTTVHEQGAPTYNIWSAYYIFRNGNEIMSLLRGPIGQRMEKAMLDNKGIRIIGYGLRGPRYLTSNRPVRNASEAKGLKIRIPLQPIYVESWKAVGAFPEAIAYGELYTALKQGIVDSQENPLSYIHAPRFDEVQKYANETLHQRAFFTYVLSELFYKRLTPELQQLLIAEGKSITEYHNELQDRNEAVLRKELQERGMVFVEVDRRSFEDAMKDIPRQFADKWEPNLYDDVLAELAKIRK